MNFYDYKSNISFAPPEIEEKLEDLRNKIIKPFQNIQRLRFAIDIQNTPAAEIEKLIDRHLRFFLREGGEVNLFFAEMRQVKDQFIKPHRISPEQVDAFLNWYEKHTEKSGLQISAKPDLNTLHTKTEDNVLKIDNYFKDCKSAFLNESDYLKAIQEIEYFFNSGKVKIKQPLFVKNKNMKRIAFAMGEIWRSRKNDVITFEYLSLYKKLFSIFDKSEIEKNNIFGCTLYKYSITKT